MKPRIAGVTSTRNPRPASRFGLRARSRVGTIAELAGFLFRNGRWWLLPMVVVFLLSGVLLAVVQALEYVAPFVYTVL